MKLFSPEPLRNNHRDRFLHLIQVSAALSRFRVQSGLSVTEAANRARIAESRLNELETGSGRYLVSKEEIAVLARIYHMSSNDVTRFYNSIRYLSGHHFPSSLLGFAAFLCLLYLAHATILLSSRLTDFEILQPWRSDLDHRYHFSTNELWFLIISLSILLGVFALLALIYKPTTKSRVWLYRASLLVSSFGLSSIQPGKISLSENETPNDRNSEALIVAFHGMRDELRQSANRARRRDLILLLAGAVLGFLVNVVTGPLVQLLFS